MGQLRLSAGGGCENISAQACFKAKFQLENALEQIENSGSVPPRRPTGLDRPPPRLR
jgi:hypothetical protein